MTLQTSNRPLNIFGIQRAVIFDYCLLKTDIVSSTCSRSIVRGISGFFDSVSAICGAATAGIGLGAGVSLIIAVPVDTTAQCLHERLQMWRFFAVLILIA